MKLGDKVRIRADAEMVEGCERYMNEQRGLVGIVSMVGDHSAFVSVPYKCVYWWYLTDLEIVS